MILKLIICVCCLAIVGIVAFQFIDPAVTNAPAGTVETTPQNKLTIGITGEVSKPGDYVFNSTEPIMEDLVGAAGGINTNGDDRCFYLDAKIESGCSYYIPPKYDNSNICSDEPISKININDGTEEELLTITGFGEAIVSAIISYRTENGVFYTLESLMNVSGIGNAKFNTCKNYIILHD